uniref:Transcription factor CBF/NF-Y/archaeal histone domain-containing protein n=1 Tax=Tetradesmus obliquus TaxID=3088 RepID=A0A383W0H4_TETOB|eukprot:jgi/Sobl393_1/12714/SZX70690.1
MEENDVSLPKATLTKMVKELLPHDMRCAAECMDMLMDCCTEFIQLLSSEANELAMGDNKSTITPEHVVRALTQLGFEEWADDVRSSHEQFKAEAKQAPKLANRKTKAEIEGLTEDEQIEMQRRLFAAARARSMNVDALAEANVQAAYGAMQQQHLQGDPAAAAAAAAAAGGQYLQQEAMHEDDEQ